jgi:hypothetical protein
MSEVINPLTGLPLQGRNAKKDGPVNPFTKQNFGPRFSTAQGPLSTSYARTGDFSDFSKYGVNYSPFANLEEERARNQSNWEKVGNGLYKAANTFVGSAAENTVGYALGLTDWVMSGFEDFQESMTNNPVGVYFDERNKMLQEEMPNFYTQEEMDKQGTLGSLGSINFWADKFANGMAYSLGSVATMMLTGGTTGLVTGLGKAAKIGTGVSKGLASLHAARALNGAKKSGDIIRRAANIKAMGQTNRASNALGYLETGAMMSMAESSVEAREVKNRVVESLNQQVMTEMGLDSVDDIPVSERRKIEEIAAQKEAIAFYGNMGILMPTNLVMFGKGLMPFTPKSMRKGLTHKIASKPGERAGWRQYTEAIDNLPGYAQKGIRASRVAYPFIEKGATEAFQEGSQYAISEGLNERAKAMYSEYGGAEVAEGLLRGGLFAKAIRDYEHIGSTALETLNTPEGREQMLIGALVGIISGGRGSIQAGKRKSKATEEALNDLNMDPETFFNLRARAKSSAMGQYYLARMDAAQARGDKKSYDDYRSRLMNESALLHAKLGTYDQYKERLEELKAMPADEVSKIVGEEVTEAEKHEMINQILESSDNVVDNYAKISDAFPGPTLPTGLAGRFMSQNGQDNVRNQIAENEALKDALLFYESSLFDTDQRVEDIIKTFETLDPKFDGEKLRNLVREEMFQEVAVSEKDGKVQTQYRQPQMNPQVSAEIRQALQEEMDKSIRRIRYGKKNDLDLRSEYVGKNRKKNLEQERDILMKLLDDRTVAAKAYEQLMTDPNERELYKKRAIALERLEEQKSIDQQVDATIGKTATSKELVVARDGLRAAGVSDAALEKLDDEAIEREQQESKKNIEFGGMKLSDVKKLNPDDMTPLEKAVWEKHIKNRKQEEPLHNLKSSDKAKADKRKRDVNEAAESRDTGAALSEQEGKTQAKEQEVVGEAQKRAVSDNSSRMTREARGATLVIDKNGRVLVDDSGQQINKDDSTSRHTADGQYIITNRAYLHDNLEGKTVTIVVRQDTDWWNNEATPEEKMDPAYNVPMYVEIDGQVVGVLDASDSPMRQVAWEQAKQGNPRAVTTTVSNMLASNIFTAANSDTRNPHFYNPSEALGPNTIVAVIGENPDTEGKTVELGLFDDGLAKTMTAEQLVQLRTDVNEIEARLNDVTDNGMNIAKGQVVFLVADPTGKHRVIVANTANLTEEAVAKAIDYMKEGNEAMLRALVGLNVAYLLDESNELALQDKFLAAEKMGETGEAIFTFRPVDSKGEPLLPDGLMMQVSSEVIRRWYDGKRRGDLLSQGNKGTAEVINLVVKPYRNDEGEVSFTPLTAEYTDQAKELTDNLDTILRNVLSRKKFQVDKNLLNGDDTGQRIVNPLRPEAENSSATYFEYLTNEATGAPRDHGTKGILGSTAKNVDGKTPFIDIGLEFSPKFEVNGEKQQEAPPQTTANKTDEGVSDVVTPSPETSRRNTTVEQDNEGFSPFAQSPIGQTEQKKYEPYNEEEARRKYEEGQKELEDLTKQWEEEGSQEAAEQLERAKRGIAERRKRRASTMYQRMLDEGIPEAEARKTVNESFPDINFVPRLMTSLEYQMLDKQKAASWLSARGIPVEFYEQARQIGNGYVHGYMERAGVKLWTQGEVGTEYHEGFHFVFRTLLSDQQRMGLYAEAMKRFGRPTQDEIGALKRMFPELSTRELRELALEEKMAEDFRDYVFAQQETANSLPGRIRKFFRDLYNMIRAMLTNPVGMRQLYSLIEANNVPKSYARTAKTLAPPVGGVNRFNERYASHKELHRDLRETIALQFEKDYHDRLSEIKGEYGEVSPATVGDIIGNKNDKGSVASWFLRASMSNANGSQLDNDTFEYIRSLIDAGQLQEAREYMQENGIQDMPHNDVHTGTLGLPTSMQQNISFMYQDVYMNWNDQSTNDQFENPLTTGWRSIMLESLQQKGYDVKLIDTVAEYETMSEEQQQHFDKIYDKGQFEMSPLDDARMSRMARIAISKIKSAAPNRLGVVTYANMDTIVRKAVSAAKNQQSTDNIMDALRKAQSFNPELRPLVDYLDSPSIQAHEHALITNLFRLDYTTHMVFERDFSDDKKRVFSYDSDRMSQDRTMLERWRTNRETLGIENPDAFYVEDENGKLTVKDAEERAKRIEESRQIYQDPSRPLADRVEAMSDMLFDLGLRTTDSRELSRQILKTYISAKTDEMNLVRQGQLDEIDVLKQFAQKIFINQLIGSAFDTRQIGNDIGKISPSENVRDMFTARTPRGKRIYTGIQYLAKEIAPRIEAMEAMGFVGGDGKMRYAYNLPTHFNYLMSQVTNGDATSLHKLMEKDPRFSVYGRAEFQDPFFLLMKKSKFTPMFGEFDVVKNTSDEVGKTTYKTLFERDSLILRIDAYLNSNNPTESTIAVSTQETRNRLTLIKGLPKLTKAGAATEYGITNSDVKTYIRNIMVQDLLGIGAALETIKNGGELIPGYHNKYGKQDTTFRDTYLLGRVKKGSKLETLAKRLHKAFKEQDEGDMYRDTVNEVIGLAEEFHDNNFNKAVSEVRQKLKDYGIIRQIEGTQKFEHSFDSAGIKNEGGLDSAIRQFVADDMIYRISMSKTFRGGTQMFKDTVDYFKRMGLINTPGNRMYMEGDFSRSPEYGMKRIFNTATLEDFTTSDPVHTEIAAGIKKAALANGATEEEADGMAKRYMTGVANATDAQGIISPAFARKIEQGNGRWTPEQEEWYKEFDKAGSNIAAAMGKWKAEYTAPYKFYYENLKLHGGNTLTIEADKNSYFVLTPEIAAQSDVLGRLYERMMDPTAPIDLVNFVTGKKGSKERAVPYEQFLEMKNEQVIVQQQGERLLMPQNIADKGTDVVRLNKQITKSTLMLVNPTDTYVLNYGTDIQSEPISGLEIKERFHNSFKELQRRAMQELKEELGLDEVDPRTGLIPEDKKVEALKKMRDVFLRNKMERDQLDENIEAQLNIIADPITNEVDFALPLGFPTYLKEYENLFFSMFRTRVFKMFMKGKEMVQVAAPGTFNVFNYETGEYEKRELRYLSVDDNGFTRHAEVMISPDIAKKYGLKPGDNLSEIPEELRRMVMYRIPHQGKSSTVIAKVAGILPKSHKKTVMVPANITEQTGSDFDIDKMFTMFPEFSGSAREGFTKDAIDPLLPLEMQSESAIRNSMLDIIEAISMSPNHTVETFKPLNTNRLEAFTKDVLKKDLLKTDYPFWHPLVEIEMEQKFKSSATGVGVYAKAMAGYAIASQGEVVQDGKQGTSVNGRSHFTLNGVSRTGIRSSRAVAGYFQEKLSSHLDAGKTPIPGLTNDNKFTHAATVFFGSFMTDATVNDDLVAIEGLMNIPSVLKFVELRKGIGSETGPLSVKMALKEMGISFMDQKQMKAKTRIQSFTKDDVLSVLQSARRAGKKGLQGEAKELENKLFNNFAIGLMRGEELQEFYEIIAPDTLDGLGEIGEIQGYLGKLQKYSKNTSPIISMGAVQQFLVDNQFGISQSYYNLITEVLSLSNNYFGSSSQSMNNFKTRVMEAVGTRDFSAAQHRAVNRAAFYWMMTRPEFVSINGKQTDINPFADMLTTERAKELFLDKRTNIAAKAARLRRAVPRLQDNYVISRIASVKTTKKSRTFGVEMNNIDDKSTDMRNLMKRDFQELLENPRKYTSDPKLQTAIKEFAEDLILNSLVRTGASPTFGSYFDSIPVEYFMTKRRSELKDQNGTPLFPTAAEFVRRQMSRAQNNPQYFDPFLFEYMRTYGLSTVDGRDLVQTVGYDTKKLKGMFKKNADGTFSAKKNPDAYPVFIKVRNIGSKKTDRYTLLQRKSKYTWEPVQQKSINGKLFEVNLRDESGTTSGTSSIITAQANKDVTRTGAKSMAGYAVEMLNAQTEKAIDDFEEMKQVMSIQKKCE